MSGIAVPASRRLLIVTVHDVAPPFAAGVRRLLDELDRRAIRPRVLKVVPCYAGRWPLADDDDLCRLLRTEVAAGSEIVAHGWTHRAQGTLRGSLGTRWRGAWLAGGAAEFLSLPAAAAQAAARSARHTLADTLGVEPLGFCAPAWLLNKEGRAAVTAAGYHFLLEQTMVRDLRTGQAIATPWQGYMGVGGFHEWLVQLGNGAIAAGARLACGGLSRCPVVKVFLHPQRLEDSPALERVLDGLTTLAAQREVVTASQLVSLRQQERTSRPPLPSGTTPPAEQPLPLVSVIVPALNEQSYIAQALRSVAQQHYPLDRVECVVVDNGSRDATAAVVQDVARRWTAAPNTMPRVQLTREPRRGTARAKNRGAAVARGDVLIFLDADSTLGPAMVPEVAAAWRDGARGGSIPVLAASDDRCERGFFRVLEFGKRLLNIHCQMFYVDRRLFRMLGGLNHDLHLAEDLDLMRRAAVSLRSGEGRLQRIGGTRLRHRNNTGAHIRTSPRRLRALPWRLGMIWMFVRWSLAFLGVGRRWYEAGGPAPETVPAAIQLTRRAAHTGLRLVLFTAGTHAPGQPAGLLWIWWLWERVYTRWYHLRPVRPEGIFQYDLGPYTGSQPLTLPDGTRIARGDTIGRLHFHNAVLAQPRSTSAHRWAWQVIEALRGDLAVLAQQAAAGDLDRPGHPVKALTGTTLFFRGARRLGFAVWARPQNWHRELDRLYLLGLLALYRPDGAARLHQETASTAAGNSADAAPARQRGPSLELGDVWMSRAALLARYLPKGGDT